LARTFVREVNHAARKLVEETVARLSAKKELVCVTIEKESQTRIEPRTPKQFEVGKSRFEIKGGKHGERLVKLTVVEKEQAVDEGSFSSGNQDVVGAAFGLKKAVGRREHRAGENNTVVRSAVKDDIFAGTSGGIVDGLKSLIGESVEFESGMEGKDGVCAKKRGWHTIAIQRGRGEGSGVDSVGYLAYAALFLESLEEVQKGATASILIIKTADFVEREEGRGLGELGKRQAHLQFSDNTSKAYLQYPALSSLSQAAKALISIYPNPLNRLPSGPQNRRIRGRRLLSMSWEEPGN
jgi:hypothetical protein